MTTTTDNLNIRQAMAEAHDKLAAVPTKTAATYWLIGKTSTLAMREVRTSSAYARDVLAMVEAELKDQGAAA